RLSAATDPANGQSYLHNSLVYFTSESGIAHGWGSHPVMLFGNAGGARASRASTCGSFATRCRCRE
ncbi:MAG: hypothetical protein JNK82_44170, partial [Myxococcaceae bacterium]|nr:hypothetical protein [Myxococcaceae bacterium]